VLLHSARIPSVRSAGQKSVRILRSRVCFARGLGPIRSGSLLTHCIRMRPLPPERSIARNEPAGRQVTPSGVIFRGLWDPKGCAGPVGRTGCSGQGAGRRPRLPTFPRCPKQPNVAAAPSLMWLPHSLVLLLQKVDHTCRVGVVITEDDPLLPSCSVAGTLLLDASELTGSVGSPLPL
jgi:hypothetical protein